VCKKSSIGATDIVTIGFNPWIRYGMNAESPIGTVDTLQFYTGHPVPTAGDPTGFRELSSYIRRLKPTVNLSVVPYLRQEILRYIEKNPFIFT